jgi:anti-anti-sigma factor
MVQDPDSLAVLDRGPIGDEVLVCVDDAMLQDGLADLRRVLDDVLVAGARRVVVDVAGVQLSSPVVATLLSAHRTCRARGGAIVLRGVNRRAEDLLCRTGLWRVLSLETARGRAA